jgi:hypothetical protein
MDMVNVKAMPGSIPAPNFGSIMEKIRKIKVAKWGKSKKHLENVSFCTQKTATVHVCQAFKLNLGKRSNMIFNSFLTKL